MSAAKRTVAADHYDVVIAGGGVLGAALAWEAALRGATPLLLEQGDFASGASSNSLKILHGGLRYLQSGNWARARRSAREQALLQSIAPHLVGALPCVIPTTAGITRGKTALGAGLSFYHRVIRLGLQEIPFNRPAYGLVDQATLASFAPLANYPGATGGAYWLDAQVTDPVRLVIEFIKSARNLGAEAHNYKRVTACNSVGGRVEGVTITDAITGTSTDITCKLLVDATGIGLPGLKASRSPAIEWCKAVNLGLRLPAQEFAFGVNASGSQDKEDRYLFMTPWRGTTSAGTWYFAGNGTYNRSEKLTPGELEVCLHDVNHMLREPVDTSAVLYADVGYLPANPGSGPLAARLLDRDRVCDGEEFGLAGYVGLTGVKFTTARRFAQDIVEKYVGRAVVLDERREICLPGADYTDLDSLRSVFLEQLPDDFSIQLVEDILGRFGAQALELAELVSSAPEYREVVPGTRTTIAELEYVITTEQVTSASDLVLRRTTMADAGAPPSAACEYVISYLADREGWNPERQESERRNLFGNISRLPEDAGFHSQLATAHGSLPEAW